MFSNPDFALSGQIFQNHRIRQVLLYIQEYIMDKKTCVFISSMTHKYMQTRRQLTENAIRPKA